MSLKTLLLFTPPLVLALMTGWRTGANAKAAALQKHAVVAAAVSSPSGPATDVATTTMPPEATPAAARAEVQRLKDFEDKGNTPLLMFRSMARLASLVARLMPEQQQTLLTTLPQDEQEGVMIALRVLAPMLSQGMTQAEHFEKIAADPATSMIAFSALASWALQDPAGALRRWKEETANKPPAPWAEESLTGFFNHLSLADPRLALEEALNLSSTDWRQSALGAVRLGNLYAGDKSVWPPDGGELVKRLVSSTPDSRQDVISDLLSARLRQESPEEALAWIESLELGADSAAWTDSALAEAWSRKDRPAAADWWLSRAAPEAKAEVAEKIVRMWTGADIPLEFRDVMPEPDLAGCAEWLNARGIGTDTEKAVAVLAEAWIGAREPAAALAWARAMNREEARAAALKNITTQIRRRHPDTWRAMLKEAGVSSAEEPF